MEAFEGEELEFIEEIDNAKPLPLPWVRSEISCSRWLSFYGGDAASKDGAQKGLISGIFTLRGRQKCRRTWRVRCEKRGMFTVEDISLTVSDLFGLVRSARVIKLNQQVRVLPVPADIESRGNVQRCFHRRYPCAEVRPARPIRDKRRAGVHRQGADEPHTLGARAHAPVR